MDFLKEKTEEILLKIALKDKQCFENDLKTYMRDLRHVIDLNVILNISRWNGNNRKHVIHNIWTDSLINRTCPSPNVSSNCPFYDRHYPSLSATFCLSHTLSFCLSAVLLFPPHKLFDIKTLAWISILSLISKNWFEPRHCFT